MNDPVLVARVDRVLEKCVESEADFNGLPCWVFTGGKSIGGYGQINALRTRKVETFTHRIVYEFFVGSIPEGLQLDHLCKVRACCNPAHLEPVTARENLLRGNTVTAQHAAKTHCPQGHEYDESNTYLWRGMRHCKACRKERMRVRHLEGSVK